MAVNANIRYVNRTKDTVRLPTRRGGRLALAPGEFATDDYYERFSRLANERVVQGMKFLTKEFLDGTPLGVDELPEDDRTRVHAPEIIRTGFTPSPSIHVASAGCETSCEASCQFPVEVASSTIDDINRTMDRQETPEQPFVPVTMQSEETPPPIVDGETIPSAASEATKTEVGSQAPVEEVLAHFSLNVTDALDITPGYVKINRDGAEIFLSRYEVGFETVKLNQMQRHLRKFQQKT